MVKYAKEKPAAREFDASFFPRKSLESGKEWALSCVNVKNKLNFDTHILEIL